MLQYTCLRAFRDRINVGSQVAHPGQVPESRDGQASTVIAVELPPKVGELRVAKSEDICK